MMMVLFLRRSRASNWNIGEIPYQGKLSEENHRHFMSTGATEKSYGGCIEMTRTCTCSVETPQKGNRGKLGQTLMNVCGFVDHLLTQAGDPVPIFHAPLHYSIERR